MMSVRLDLTAPQLKAMKKAHTSEKPYVLKISKRQMLSAQERPGALAAGKHELKLTKKQFQDFSKHRAAGSGCTIELSRTALKKIGGFLGMPLAGMILGALPAILGNAETIIESTRDAYSTAAKLLTGRSLVNFGQSLSSFGGGHPKDSAAKVSAETLHVNEGASLSNFMDNFMVPVTQKKGKKK